MKKKATFLEYNWYILIIEVLLIAGDLVHLLFKGMPFKYDSELGLDSIVYYIMSAIGMYGLVPSIIVYKLIPKYKTSTRTLAFGLILYNLVKLIKEICFANGVPVSVHEIDSIDIAKYLGILVVLIVTAVAYRKWKQ